MRQSIIFITVMALCAACTQSIEEKAEKYVKKELRAVLSVPTSYEPLQTKVDSAFASIYFDYDAYKAALKIKELAVARESIERRINYEKIEVAQYSENLHWGASFKEHYRQAKEKLGKLENELQNNEKEVQKQKDFIKTRYKEIDEKQWIGWIIAHRMRCDNRIGNSSVSDMVFVVDENFEKTLFRISLDNDDPQNMVDIATTINEVLAEEEPTE